MRNWEGLSGGAVAPWPHVDLQTLGFCPLCKSSRRTVLHESITDNVYQCTPGVWRLFRCHECSAGYLDPRPTPQSIGRVYQHYCTHEPVSEERIETFSRLRYVRRALSNGYINRRHGVTLTPSLSLGAWVIPFLPGKKSQIDSVHRYLPPKTGARARLLDIGCGNGSFLRTSRRLGWECHGVDPDPKAVAHGAHLGAAVGGFPDLAFPDSHFQAVTLSHVIEHVHGPVSALREVFRVLAPGGCVIIMTPNIRSMSHKYFGSDWIGLHAPAHLIIFSLEALSQALLSAGFCKLRFHHVFGQARDNFELSKRVSLRLLPFAHHSAQLSGGARVLAHLADVVGGLVPSIGENLVVKAYRPL